MISSIWAFGIDHSAKMLLSIKYRDLCPMGIAAIPYILVFL
jgi:hypothetical protein